jgi:predicted lipoprotein with Yx(FWY)xxD motif
MLRLLGFVIAAAAIATLVGLLSAPAPGPTPIGTGETRPTSPTPLTDPVAPTAGSATADGTAEDAAPRTAALVARHTDRLGQLVVDREGFTLYRFDNDTPGNSTCVDACLSTWIPVTVDPAARLALDGIDTSRVGLVRRAEGTFQLTINNWPVYRFAGDTQPGRNTGHGIGGKWFAITPTGAKAAPP